MDTAPIVMKGRLLLYFEKNDICCIPENQPMKIDSVSELQLQREVVQHHTLSGSRYVFIFKLPRGGDKKLVTYRVQFIESKDGPTIDGYYTYWVTGYDLYNERLVWLLVSHKPGVQKIKA